MPEFKKRYDCSANSVDLFLDVIGYYINFAIRTNTAPPPSPLPQVKKCSVKRLELSIKRNLYLVETSYIQENVIYY